MVKIADRLDNLRHLDGCKKDFQRKQIEETREKYLPVIKRLLAIAPKREHGSAERLQREILDYLQLYESRFATR